MRSSHGLLVISLLLIGIGFAPAQSNNPTPIHTVGQRSTSGSVIPKLAWSPPPTPCLRRSTPTCQLQASLLVKNRGVTHREADRFRTVASD